MKKILRIAVGTLLPPLIGGIIFFCYVALTNPSAEAEYLLPLIWVLAFSYVLMGWQSLFYALVMEFLVFDNTISTSKVILISAALGLLMSLSLFIFGKSFFPNVNWVIPCIGIITGALVGYILLKLIPKPTDSNLW